MLKESKKVAFHTLGCKLNFSETSYLSKLLMEKGFQIVDFDAPADYYIVQSCTVTETAEKKCRTLIRGIKKRMPQSKIAVVGCYPEIKKTELKAMPEVDFVLGNFDKYQLAELLENSIENAPNSIDCEVYKSIFVPTFSSGDRTRTFLKVQDGCDYFCTYCTIPYARGRSRSNTIAETLTTAQQAIQSGAKEIILTGVNVGDFGTQHGETFLDLIKALDAIIWDGRIRLSSVEPELLNDDIISFVASSRHFMPHFHIPLQSGSNKILKLMHRRYQRELFAQRVEQIKTVLPFACIAVDVIVGFPGETEADFSDTYQFLESLDVSVLHVFPYSARPGTPASAMKDQVPVFQRRERSKKLQQLSEEKKRHFVRCNVGRVEKVLFETAQAQGMMGGFTQNYIRVVTKFDSHLINKETSVLLQEFNRNNEFIYNK